jgi:four helix bundle protein
MGTFRDLALADVAEQVADEINDLIDHGPVRLIHVRQLRDSAQSVSANIREGFGRATRGDRDRSLHVARGEAEEAIGHLRANFAAKRIAQAIYWRLRNRLITIVKMIDRLLAS